MLDTEGTHVPEVIVHAKTLLPVGAPVIVVFANKEFVITPPPETKVHFPTPTPVAVLAAMVAVGADIQTV